VWAYCQQHDIPMWSAEMLLDFTRARGNSKFLNIDYAGGQLDFDFTFAGADRTDLTIMIPATWQADEVTSIEIDGAPISWVLQTIKGIEYAMFTPQSMNGHIAAIFTTPLLAGDYNHNGQVDAADYVVWRAALGSTTDLAADGNGNLIVDEGDYGLWRANFGSTQLNQAVAVPEPTATLSWLVAIGLSFLARRRCMRNLTIGS
jgi:hypothetical protein